MEQKTLKPPLCSKHGCEKVWRKDNRRKAGGAWVCLTCRRASHKRWYDSHKEQEAARQSKYNRENSEKIREYNRKHYSANREYHASHQRSWRASNPEKVISYSQERRARKLAATSPLCVMTAAAITERFALTDGCAYCGVDAKKTADHVVPFKLGGLHVPSNIVGACLSCNSSKNDSPVEEWYRKQPFFSEQRWQRIQQIIGQGQLSLI